MTYSKGDVILIPFPFTDASASKRRPALVISNSAHHNQFDKILCLAITSQTAANRFDYQVIDCKKAGLLFDVSWVLVDKIFTTEKKFIIKKLGELDTGELTDVMKMFDSIIK